MSSILSTIGSYARAAVPGAVAARVGYKRGEEEREQREIAQATAARADKRQSMLDQINARKSGAEIDKLKKETELLGHEHPKLLDDEYVGDGPVLYDEKGTTTPLLDSVGQPIKRRPKPKPPVRGTPEYNEAVRQEAEIRSRYRTGSGTDPKDKELNDQIRNVNSQIGATDRASTANTNDFDSPEATVRARADSLHTRRDSLTHVGDSLNQVQRNRAAARPGAGGGRGGGGVQPKLTPSGEGSSATKTAITQDQYDFLTTPIAKGGKGMSAATVNQLYTVQGAKRP